MHRSENQWRTNRTPLAETRDRPSMLPEDVARDCIARWLLREVEILRPAAVLTFGAEVYEQLWRLGNIVSKDLVP